MRRILTPFLLACTALIAGCTQKDSLVFENPVDPAAPEFVGYQVLSPDDLVNLPVLALMKTPEVILPNIPYTFVAIASDPNSALLPDEQPGQIESIRWNFGDGTIIEDGDATETHTYTTQGLYAVFVTVCDNDGNCRSLSVPMTVYNNPPSVNPGDGYTVRAGDELTLNGEVTDYDGEVVLIQWDFNNDGIIDWSSESTAVATWVYDTQGTYVATLKAQDNCGAWSQASAVVEVLSDLPTCTAGGPYEGKINWPIAFHGAADDSVGYITLYEWDFDGDGTFEWWSEPGSSHFPGWGTHTFTVGGIYQAVLRVTNDIGRTATDTAEVTVTNLPPTAEAYGTRVVGIGDETAITGSGSDPDGSIVLYEWDFDGDGWYDWSSSANGTASQIQFPTEGRFTAYFRVTDDDGNTAVDSTMILVYDAPNYASTVYDRTLSGHSGSVRCVAFNDDGTLLASAGFEGEVRIWRTSDGMLLRQFTEHGSAVMAVAFVPGSDLVVSAGLDSTALVWSASDGTVAHTLTGLGDAIYSLAVTTDGGWVAAGGYSGRIGLWNVNTGWYSATCTAHPGGVVRGLSFTSDCEHLVSAGDDGYVRVWTRAGLPMEREFFTHQGGTLSVATVPETSRIVTGGATNTASLWDASLRMFLQGYAGHSMAVTSVAVPRHGQCVVTGSEDESVRIWDLGTGQSVRELRKYPSYVYSVAISPDGRMIASAGYGNVVLWKTAY